jgi:hypothetical protein
MKRGCQKSGDRSEIIASAQVDSVIVVLGQRPAMKERLPRQ